MCNYWKLKIICILPLIFFKISAIELPPNYKLIPLLQASKDGNIKQIEDLIKQGVQINGQDIGGFTALHFAASQGKLDIVKFLVGHGANVNIVSSQGSPLTVAVNYLPVVEYLINNGANIELGTQYGTPLIYAIKAKKTDVVSYLLNKGAKFGTDIFSFAAIHGNDEIVGLLLTKTTNLQEARNALGKVMLDVVCYPKAYRIVTDRLDLIKKLVLRRANLSTIDKENMLRCAAQYDFPMVQYLVEKLNVDVNAKDANGNTPLHFTTNAISGYIAVIVHYLIKHGANINAKNNEGKTPLDGKFVDNDVRKAVQKALEELNQKPLSTEEKIKKGFEDTGEKIKEFFTTGKIK